MDEGKQDVSQLTKLGSNTTDYHFEGPHSGILEVFPFEGNNTPTQRAQTVTYSTSEFTSLCPKTKQPDFGSIEIEYTPRSCCVETKSLKMYLFAFRNEGTFMEVIVKKIADDLQRVLDALELRVTGTFASRGGVVVKTEATRYALEGSWSWCAPLHAAPGTEAPGSQTVPEAADEAS